MTNTPPTITYAIVVCRDTVRIVLTMETLHDLSIKTADIMNAYIKALFVEKVYTILGPEFGPDKGKLDVIDWLLYGIKSASALFLNHLSDCIQHMGYNPCLAEPNLWMIPKTRKSNTL